ncbi:MAG: PLP-dependent transferase [Alphaproteobacteria bacterium]|nr:PLP-dependent transferase [Alphaproteobacteria bacterium]
MSSSDRPFKFGTRAVHAGQEPDPTTGAVMTPIYATSTYAQQSPGVHKGFDYARAQNPTRFAFERCLADLESGKAGFAFASGLAAEATVLDMLDAGAHVVSVDNLYGGTFRLFERVRARSAGLKFSYAAPGDLAALEAAIRPETRMIWVETPTNPLLHLADLEAVAALGRRKKILTVCDNTFASPAVQRPLEFGFDLVVHSVTKYVNGHSDMIGGAVVVGDQPELEEKVRFLQMSLGGILDPFPSFLALRGLKTLHLRMERHCANAIELAGWLEGHKAVKRVLYPGLESHPQHALARRQMDGFGGMVTVELKADGAATRRVMERFQVFTLAESLGGVESLAGHPPTMTHAAIPPEMRARLGIGDNMMRLSVGIEDVEDLKADLDQAMSVAR